MVTENDDSKGLIKTNSFGGFSSTERKAVISIAGGEAICERTDRKIVLSDLAYASASGRRAKPTGEKGGYRLTLVKLKADVLTAYGEISCGNQYLNDIYNTEKIPNNGLTQSPCIFSLIDLDTKEVIGYFSTSTSSIKTKRNFFATYFGKNSSNRSLIDILLGRDIKSLGCLTVDYFAIANKFQGLKVFNGDRTISYANILMEHCLIKLRKIYEENGCKYVVLHSTRAGRPIYVKSGFRFPYEEDAKIFLKDYPNFTLYGERVTSTSSLFFGEKSDWMSYPAYISDLNCKPMILNLETNENRDLH